MKTKEQIDSLKRVRYLKDKSKVYSLDSSDTELYRGIFISVEEYKKSPNQLFESYKQANKRKSVLIGEERMYPHESKESYEKALAYFREKTENAIRQDDRYNFVLWGELYFKLKENETTNKRRS